MKRSKIFLGLTDTLLAVAGAVTAKATHFGVFQAFYFTIGGHCKQVNSGCNRSTAATARTCFTAAGAAKYFTKIITSNLCYSTLLYTRS